VGWVEDFLTTFLRIYNMFKKTVIAAALAATTGVAMADVSVSGRVEQGFSDEDNAATGYSSFTDNQLNFKATEDLGNGMTAFAQISYKQATRLDEKVGLKGGFGTVVVGRMEDFTEGVMAASMSTMGTNEGELGGNANRNDGAVAYISPTVGGFHVGVAGYAGLSSADSDNFDGVDIMAAYTNGPLTVMVAKETLNNDAANATAGSTITKTAAGTADQETTSFAVKYSMGDLSVAALRVSRENQRTDESASVQADSDDNMYRLDYKMGANKITLQHAEDDSANNDINIIELSHALSKRTSVYIGSADGDTAATSNTYVGMQHTF